MGDDHTPLVLVVGVERASGSLVVLRASHGLDRAAATAALQASLVQDGVLGAVAALVRRCASWILEQRAAGYGFILQRRVPVENLDDVLPPRDAPYTFIAHAPHHADFLLLAGVTEALEPAFTLVHTVAALPPPAPGQRGTGRAGTPGMTPGAVALSPLSSAYASLSPGSGFTPGLDATPSVATPGATTPGATPGGSTLTAAAAGMAAASRSLVSELRDLPSGQLGAAAVMDVASRTMPAGALPTLGGARHADFACPVSVSRSPRSWLDALDALRYADNGEGM